LGALSLGHSIVYANVLTQLAVPAVDFTKAGTQCTVLQAIQQAGPSDLNIERSGHGILTEARFGHTMLRQLGTALEGIEENWESFRAVATFSLVARRVLSLTSAQDVRYQAFNYLVDLCRVCLKWLSKLKQRTATSTDDKQRTELFSRATEIALLCISTYDVEDVDFDAIFEHASAISTLIRASIIVQENHQSVKPEHLDLFRSTL
jgi:hypothetical protein